MDFHNLEAKVEQWAHERGIPENSDVLAQAHKTIEESAELVEAATKIQNLHKLIESDESLLANHTVAEQLVSAYSDYADAIGDVLVTLIIGCQMTKLSVVGCLETAYNQIKDRKGKMQNGMFVKEAA